MLTDLPIACSLTASELPKRLQQMADLGKDALLETQTEDDRAQLRFAAGTGVRERVGRSSSPSLSAARFSRCASATSRTRSS